MQNLTKWITIKNRKKGRITSPQPLFKDWISVHYIQDILYRPKCAINSQAFLSKVPCLLDLMQGLVVDHFIIFCYIDSIAPSTTKLMIELSNCINSTIQDGRSCEYPYPYFMNIFSIQVFLWVGLLLTYYIVVALLIEIHRCCGSFRSTWSSL